MPITTYTESTIATCKQPFAVKSGGIWYAFPKSLVDATLSDYKLWADDNGRTLSGDMKGTLIGVFPKLQLKVGKQKSADRAKLTALLNKSAVTVRAYCVERQRFEQADFYFGDVTNKIKHWDAKGTLGTRSNTGIQNYSNNSTYEAMQFSVISLKKRS